MTLTEEQLSQLDTVEQTCFHGSWTREMLLEEINSPLSVLVTEQREGKIIGFALGRVIADEAELYRIGVLPEFRREHIGQALLGCLHDKMKERGAACCFLEVRSRNAPAIALYKRSGYERISVRRGYYGDDDAVIFRKIFKQGESKI